MAKDKKRGFFSWLGFGQKEQTQETETEQKVEAQQEVEEQAPESEVAAAAPETVDAVATERHDAEAFAADVVEVTEQVVESEQPQAVVESPVVEEIAEQLVVEEIVAEPLVEEVIAEPVVAEVVVEQTPEEVIVEPEATVINETEDAVIEDPKPDEPAEDAEADITDEELEAQALAAADAAENAVEVVPDETVVTPLEQEKPTKEGFFARLKRSLVKTKQNLGSGFIRLFRGKKIDDDLFEELEEQLLIADVGVETTRKIITNLTDGASRKQLRDAEALYGLLKEEMGDILAKVDEPLNVEGKTPFVILMVGVNGVGKTTTIGKLARQFEQQGKSVMLAAGDTFRAAAVEQLQVWGQRNNIPVVAQHTGADSASVIFDAIQAAKARNIDVLIADTAGRLQNKSHLMEELKKIVRVMKKLDVDAPHEIMLTIDASTGQNAISQAKLFHEAVGLTGITLTKLDGTAKGGVIFSVADQFGIPIRYIGVGERIEDLRPFNAGDFIEALFARED
ncbi:MAG TPA: signal recognition particle-docking protein FtsY [Klebsiella sp.]